MSIAVDGDRNLGLSIRSDSGDGIRRIGGACRVCCGIRAKGRSQRQGTDAQGGQISPVITATFRRRDVYGVVPVLVNGIRGAVAGLGLYIAVRQRCGFDGQGLGSNLNSSSLVLDSILGRLAAHLYRT